MNDDLKLKEQLQTWRDIEPAPGFEDRVWRRIEADAPVARPTFAAWLLESLRAEPRWVPAVSAVAGVVVAVLVILPFSHRQTTDLSFLSPDTVSGSYVRLATGSQP